MTVMTAPFVFDGRYSNVEQVRPHFNEFRVVRQSIADAGADGTADRLYYRQIPSLLTAERDDQTTAVYLLQMMHKLDTIRDQVTTFENAGGRHITVNNLTDRDVLHGTVAHYGWELGGTGWEVLENVDLIRTKQNLSIRGKNGRARTESLAGHTVMFLETPRQGANAAK